MPSAEFESIDIFKTNLLERALIFWETRNLGLTVEKLIDILSVSIFFDKAVYPKELQVAEEILHKYLKEEYDIKHVMERIRIRINGYIEDYHTFLLDRERVFDIISEDIQFYSMMRDIFEADGHLSDFERQAEEAIKKQYDEHWQSKEAEIFYADKKNW